LDTERDFSYFCTMTQCVTQVFTIFIMQRDSVEKFKSLSEKP